MTPRHGVRSGRRKVPIATVIAIASLAAMPFGGDRALASGGTLSVSPSSAVAVGATVTVSGTGITTAGGQLFTGAVALLQCGNATSDGTPLATIGKTDCDTSAQLANLVFATVTDGVLPPTSFTTRTSGIGANARTCIPTPPATVPCAIALGDIATTGATVQTAATYTLAATLPTTTTTPTTTTSMPTTTAVPTTTAPSAPAGPVSVSPSSGVAAGATVTVSGTGITTAGGQLFTGAVALLQCGNATSDGTPLATIGKTDCDTSAQLANLVFATVTDGVLPPTSFTTRTSGIGANARTCIPTPPATVPCAIALGDIATTGATVQTAATYTLASAAPGASNTTTTTTAVPTTTAPSAPAGPVSVSPSSGVAVGATVTVSGTGITTAGGQLFTGAVALLQCGNATSDGTPLATIGKTDCDTSAQLANLVFATVTDGVLPPTSFTTRTSGIGANARTCIPTPPATVPCAIAVGDIATTGATVQTAATYTLVGSASTAPTTTVASVTGGTLASTGPTTAIVIGQVIAALALAQLGYLAILVLRPTPAREARLR